MRIGFACAWRAPPEQTWSHTPWNLRAALRDQLGTPAVPDLDVSYSRSMEFALKLANARRHNGRWVSYWPHSRIARAHTSRELRRRRIAVDCDVVLQIGDLGVVDRPFMLLQDFSFDALLMLHEHHGEVPHFPALSRSAMLRLRDRQRRIYDEAAVLLPMSTWLAEILVSHSGVPSERIRVVHPGISAVHSVGSDRTESMDRRLAGPRTRLLFVGTDFETKGGSQVVEAFGILRREIDPRFTLTIAGPREWPLPGPIPDGVDFLGKVPLSDVVGLYDRHDLFVVPSVVEGFGIVFVEALARGLPCVGRDAFAMPEFIRPGANGALVSGLEPQELADAIVSVLNDDRVYEATAADSKSVGDYFSWSRAAQDVVEAARAVA